MEFKTTLLYHTRSQKTSPDTRASLGLICALFWDGGGIEGASQKPMNIAQGESGSESRRLFQRVRRVHGLGAEQTMYDMAFKA